MAAPLAVPSHPQLRIEARAGWRPLDLQELWRYRELLWFLALRDIQVRYKQTLLGAAWAVLQPTLTMIVFTIFFGYLGGMSQRLEPGVSYPVYTFGALLPWQLFAFALAQSSNSLVQHRGLLTKIYFPRLIIPMAPLPCGLLDFSVSFVVMIALMLGFGQAPGSGVVMLPLFVALALATSLAVGLWLAAINAVYRDVQYVVPFLIQLWLFITPVAYPSSIVPQEWRWLYGLNPMAGVVDGFRWALLGGTPPGPMLAVSASVTCVLLVSGLYYFRRMERIFADVI